MQNETRRERFECKFGPELAQACAEAVRLARLLRGYMREDARKEVV
jgi:hypothetical protein